MFHSRISTSLLLKPNTTSLERALFRILQRTWQTHSRSTSPPTFLQSACFKLQVWNQIFARFLLIFSEAIAAGPEFLRLRRLPQLCGCLFFLFSLLFASHMWWSMCGHLTKHPAKLASSPKAQASTVSRGLSQQGKGMVSKNAYLCQSISFEDDLFPFFLWNDFWMRNVNVPTNLLPLFVPQPSF